MSASSTHDQIHGELRCHIQHQGVCKLVERRDRNTWTQRGQDQEQAQEGSVPPGTVGFGPENRLWLRAWPRLEELEGSPVELHDPQQEQFKLPSET